MGSAQLRLVEPAGLRETGGDEISLLYTFIWDFWFLFDVAQ